MGGHAESRERVRRKRDEETETQKRVKSLYNPCSCPSELGRKQISEFNIDVADITEQVQEARSEFSIHFYSFWPRSPLPFDRVEIELASLVVI